MHLGLVHTYAHTQKQGRSLDIALVYTWENHGDLCHLPGEIHRLDQGENRPVSEHWLLARVHVYCDEVGRNDGEQRERLNHPLKPERRRL